MNRLAGNGSAKGGPHTEFLTLANVRAPRVSYGIFNGLLLLTLASKRKYRTNLWVAKEVVEVLGADLVKVDSQPTALRNYPNNTLHRCIAGRPRLVYNIDQVADSEAALGLSFLAVTPPGGEVVYKRSMELKNWLTNHRSLVVVHARRAAYVPSWDLVMMPPRELFETEQGEANYWATFWHEVVHWTGHSSRLSREPHRVWGDRTYAFEELIAELGAAFLCSPPRSLRGPPARQLPCIMVPRVGGRWSASALEGQRISYEGEGIRPGPERRLTT